MKKLWWRFYTWPEDNTIVGTCIYNCFGNAVDCTFNGVTYLKFPFFNLWWREIR